MCRRQHLSVSVRRKSSTASSLILLKEPMMFRCQSWQVETGNSRATCFPLSDGNVGEIVINLQLVCQYSCIFVDPVIPLCCTPRRKSAPRAERRAICSITTLLRHLLHRIVDIRWHLICDRYDRIHPMSTLKLSSPMQAPQDISTVLLGQTSISVTNGNGQKKGVENVVMHPKG